MCDPVTFGFAAVQAIGSMQQGRAQQTQANIAAGEAELAAGVERSDAAMEAARIRRAGEAQRGQTVAGFAGAGVKVGEGSALDAERQVMEDVARDEYMAIITGERRASGLEREARYRRMAGSDARRAGELGAATSLLSAGASYARASGWRSRGPGFSGTQMPAPVESRNIPRTY